MTDLNVLVVFSLENNKIKFNTDGTAEFCFNGNNKEYEFAFVNESWNKKWMKNDSECAIIVYNPNSPEDIHTFIYNDKTTLVP